MDQVAEVREQARHNAWNGNAQDRFVRVTSSQATDVVAEVICGRTTEIELARPVQVE